VKAKRWWSRNSRCTPTRSAAAPGLCRRGAARAGGAVDRVFCRATCAEGVPTQTGVFRALMQSRFTRRPVTILWKRERGIEERTKVLRGASSVDPALPLGQVPVFIRCRRISYNTIDPATAAFSESTWRAWEFDEEVATFGTRRRMPSLRCPHQPDRAAQIR